MLSVAAPVGTAPPLTARRCRRLRADRGR